MATAQTLINRAMRLIGATASGENPSVAETADCLTALNDLIESWQTERLYVYAMVDTAYTLVPGAAFCTVGPAGNFALTPRPAKLEGVYVRDNNLDTPLELLDFRQWNSIADKSSSGSSPEYCYYSPDLTTGKLYLYPVPSKAASLHIVTWATVASLATAATTLTLPQGYQRALAYNLALDVAHEFEKKPSEELIRIAAESKGNVKRANLQVPVLGSDVAAALGFGGRSRIEEG